MPCEPPRCAACSARSEGLCAAFADGDITLLHAIGRQRSAAAGQVLVWEGEPISFYATLVSGVLKIVRAGLNGQEQIVGLLFPGDFVGEPRVEHAADSVVALVDASLCVYPRAALERLLDTHPPAARLLLRRSLTTLADTRRWMLVLGRRDAREKVAGFLLDMAARQPNAGAFELPMSRGAIGKALGLTIETVSRQMTALARAGVIALPGGRAVQFLDRPTLAALANG